METRRSRSARRPGAWLVTAAVALVLAVLGVPALSSAAARHASGAQTQAPLPSQPGGASDRALRGTGVWIWELGRSDGGSPSAIASRARSHGARTLFVKSSDGSTWWPQFSASLVSTLHAAGLHVCAWQYVYGIHPATEARLGARAARVGADCLVIDAEAEYEGKYAQAATYIQHLRAGVGAAYPVALTSFPYVDYHPALPYSVFLGPGGAQFNLPQMYWRAIGTTVDAVYAHTMEYNLVYGRQVFPLGQLWENPTPHEIVRFRQLALAYGSTGVSWWDWQEASPRGWRAVARAIGAVATAEPGPTYPYLSRGARGDLVVLAQERLRAAGFHVAVNGVFGSSLVRALRKFQRAHHLSATGMLDGPTWWQLGRYGVSGAAWHGSVTAAAVEGRNGPRSAWLPAVRYELPPKAHSGG